MNIGLKVKFKKDIEVSLPTKAGILTIPVRKGRTGVVSEVGDVLVVKLDEPLQTGHDIAVDNVKWRGWDDALNDIFITGKDHLRLVAADGEPIDES